MLIFHTTVKYAGVSIQHLLSLGSRSPAETLSICNWVLCWINQQFIFFTKITSSPLTQIYINNLCQITCQGKTYKILSYHLVTLSPIFHFLYFSNLYTRKVEIHCSRACKPPPQMTSRICDESFTSDSEIQPEAVEGVRSPLLYDSKFLWSKISRMA